MALYTKDLLLSVSLDNVRHIKNVKKKSSVNKTIDEAASLPCPLFRHYISCHDKVIHISMYVSADKGV